MSYHVWSFLMILYWSLAALAGRTWRNLLGNEVGDAVMACDSSQWQCPVAPVGRGLEGRSATRVASGARSDELLVAVGKSAGRSERSRRLALQWKLYIWTCWSMLINVDQCWSMLINVDQCWSMLIILSYYHINIWSARTYISVVVEKCWYGSYYLSIIMWCKNHEFTLIFDFAKAFQLGCFICPYFIIIYHNFIYRSDIFRPFRMPAASCCFPALVGSTEARFF